MGRPDTNRPVHLALRDRCYGEFLQMLQYSFVGRPLKTRATLIREMANSLREAMESARFALRGDDGEKGEQDFARFLRLLHDSARTVEFVIHHEELLREDSSFLRRFLGANLDQISENYLQVRGEQILKEIKLLASLAEGAYLELKSLNFNGLEPDERRRYAAMASSSSAGPDE